MRVAGMFAGIGGICLAFKNVGADIVWANEIDGDACETYRNNFGGNYLCGGDIRRQSLDSVPDFDILTAGFPCQPFSVMGAQKGLADPRGAMYFEVLRMIDAKQPPLVLLENVKNLVYHDDGRTFKTIIGTLTERHYGAKWAIMGPHTHSDIPQYRDRIFIAAFRRRAEWNKFEFPGGITLKKVINDIVDRSACQDEGYYYRGNSRYFDDLNKRMTDDKAIYRIDDSGTAMRAWRICPTLKANMGTYHDRVPVVRDSGGIRKLTVRECLDFQGFPKDYEFPGIPQNEQYKQLGNTVCVPVVERIAERLCL